MCKLYARDTEGEAENSQNTARQTLAVASRTLPRLRPLSVVYE